MIELMQYKYPTFSNMVNKLDTTSIIVNRDLVLKDIEKVKKALSKSRVLTYNRENLRAIEKYLKKLLENLKEDFTIELAWNIDKDTELPVSYPIKLAYDGAYGINTCNYIEVEPGSKLVDIDTLELADIISFEFMYKDLGETHDDIEEELATCGVTTIEDASILLEYIKKLYGDGSLFELSKTYKVSDSPYYIRESGEMQDYFGNKTFKAERYRNAVTYSCQYANTVILNNIFKEANRLKLSIKLLLIDATRIQFIIKGCQDELIRDTLIGDIVIRILGRKFKLNNKINIY